MTAVVSRAGRPRVILPARFSASASALRFAAEVTARRLVEAVFRAGGEPLTVHPSSADGLTTDDLERRFGFADALLLPGGGDLHPRHYGGRHHDELYDVDEEQDAVDLALAGWALATGRPLLAICRGLQVTNVQLGGSIDVHMDVPHRSVVADLDLDADSQLARLVGTDRIRTSCFHHQRLASLGAGLRPIARVADGTVEAVELDGGGWFVGVQWHPEDTADSDPAQARLFAGLVDAARGVAVAR